MAMADGSSPVDRLVAQLSRSSRNLKSLRTKLGFPPATDTNLVLTPLSRYVATHQERILGMDV